MRILRWLVSARVRGCKKSATVLICIFLVTLLGDLTSFSLQLPETLKDRSSVYTDEAMSAAFNDFASGADRTDSAATLTLYKKFNNISSLNNTSGFCPLLHTPADMSSPQPKAEELRCAAHCPPLFTSSYAGVSQVRNPAVYGLKWCCLREIVRIDDFAVRKSRKCRVLQGNGEKQPFEFGEVLCLPKQARKLSQALIVDTLALPSIREQHLPPLIAHSHDPAKLNVIVWAFSAMSRFQIYRTMPKTLEYLLVRLKAIEYVRLSRVGDRFSSLMALLTASKKRGLDECWPNKTFSFDDCPLLWKRFAEEDYVTLFAEDDPVGVFRSGKPGFNDSPSHAYYRPWSLHSRAAHFPCVGPHLAIRKVLDYAKSFTEEAKFVNRKFFQFIWTHVPEFSWPLDIFVQDYLEFLTPLLNKTVLVFLSTEGFPFGPARSNRVGSFESRNPFLFYVLPTWFPTIFPAAATNIRENRLKLTTLREVHETLYDLLDLPSSLSDRSLAVAEAASIGSGHFHAMPYWRSCAQADISDHDCLCNDLSTECIEDASLSRNIGAYVVHWINKVLANFNAILKICAYVRLRQVLCLQKVYNKERNPRQGAKAPVAVYRITFRTSPGTAVYEATVRVVKEKIQLAGGVDRIDDGERSTNCTEDEEFRRFCICSK